MKKKIHLIFIAQLFILKVCLCKQLWEEEPSYTEVNPGESATLACKIFNKEGTCSWQKDGKIKEFTDDKYEWNAISILGKCKLIIINVTIVDAGDWKCQDGHQTEDSYITKLLVNADPVGIKRNNFTVEEGATQSIRCHSPDPPALIKWFIDSIEINSTTIEENLEEQNESILQRSFTRNDHQKLLKCEVFQDSWKISTAMILNVLYVPEVKLILNPSWDIEEGQERVALQCLSDANPPATIQWKRFGEENAFSFQEIIEFNPATRKNSGTYACQATNLEGSSNYTSIYLDVKYPPEHMEVSSIGAMKLSLYSAYTVSCSARSNPLPRFEWIMTLPDDQLIVVSSSPSLNIVNATYLDGGSYHCIAYNVINNTIREVQSQSFNLSLYGSPIILPNEDPEDEDTVSVNKGRDAILECHFCSNPPPTKVIWYWDDLQLDPGNARGHYVSERILPQGLRQDCFLVRLRIQNVALEDSKNYSLLVVNENGQTSKHVSLQVMEPVTMVAIIGVVMICLMTLATATIVIFYSFKSEWCCFPRLILASFPAYVPKKPRIHDQDRDHPLVNMWLNKYSFSNLQQKKSFSDESCSIGSRFTDSL